MRDSRVLVSLLTPIILAILYNSIFPGGAPLRSEGRVRRSGDLGASCARSRTRAGQTVEPEAAARRYRGRRRGGSSRAEDVDAAFVLPPDVDDAVRQGRRPTITLIQPATEAGRELRVGLARGRAARRSRVSRRSRPWRSSASQAGSTDSGVMGELGTRRYFVLATVVMMLGMIAVLAVPIILTEEAEKKTLDALLLVANYREVILGKALVGVAYSAVSVAIMLGLTRLQPLDMATFVAGTGSALGRHSSVSACCSVVCSRPRARSTRGRASCCCRSSGRHSSRAFRCRTRRPRAARRSRRSRACAS